MTRSRRKAPPLASLDRILMGLGAICVSSAHTESSGCHQTLDAVAISPSAGSGVSINGLFLEDRAVDPDPTAPSRS